MKALRLLNLTVYNEPDETPYERRRSLSSPRWFFAQNLFRVLAKRLARISHSAPPFFGSIRFEGSFVAHAA